MATTTVRPISDDAVYGTVTKVPNVASWQNVDDAPSDDATYITCSAWGSGVLFGLADITLTATQRIKQVKARIRGLHNSADVGHTDYVDVRFRDPVTGNLSAATTLGTSNNSPQALETGWYMTTPNNGAWTETVADRLQVTVGWRARDTGLTQFRLTELYVDFEIHEQPVVSAVTVTGATSTTRPTFAWTYSTVDINSDQVRWQARVFSSAQSSITGFNAATSPSTWDSGQVIGAITTSVIGADLLNAVSYTVYVRAARTWQGPAGRLWWSDYVASSPFTISLVAPAQPTVTAAAEPTLPGYRARVVVGLGGLNILEADSAGFDSSIGFWVAGANTNTPALSAVNPKSGTNDLLLTATAAGSIEALSGSFATSRRIDPGSVVSVTGSFRALVTGRSCSVGVRFFDVSGATLSTPMGSTASDTTGGYTTATLLNQTAPAGSYSMVARVLITSAVLGEQHRLDEAGILLGATAPWTPGGAAQSGSVLVERSLRVSSSISRAPARNWVHPQLYSGGALTGSTDGFYARQANDSVIQQPLDRAAPESPTSTTAGMIEWVIRVGSFSYVDVGAPDGVATDGMHPYMFPAVPGLGFTGSLWLWASSAITVRLGLIYVDAFNTQVGSTTLTSNTVLSTTAQRLTVSATAPAGTVYARLVVEDTLAATGISVFMTQPKFRLTADPDETWPGQVFAFTWETVRFGLRAIPQNGDTTMAFYDHEAPSGRPVLYRATINATSATGDVISSKPAVPVHIYMDEPARALLKDPWQPENAAVVNVWPGDSLGGTEDAVVLHPMGRDEDPVFLRSWRGTDRHLELSCLSDLEFYRLQQLLPTTTPLLLQWPEGGNEYLRITGWEATRTRPGFYRTVNITGSVTARPTP